MTIEEQAGYTKLLDLIQKRIEHHLKFFDSLENIRWKFTSGFGVGSAVALFLAAVSESSVKKLLIAHVIVWTLSFAAIVTQVRIYALVVVIWRRILAIQEFEGRALRRMLPVDDALCEALYFPRVGVFRSRFLHLFTVGMVSCFVFAVLIGLSVGLLWHQLTGERPQSYAIASLSVILVSLLSVAGARRYIAAVESSDVESISSSTSFPSKR